MLISAACTIQQPDITAPLRGVRDRTEAQCGA